MQKSYKQLINFKAMAKILHVEDDLGTQETLNLGLKIIYNHEVICAYNGLEALAHLEKEKDIEIIISDCDMDKMNGCEFIEIVRKDLKYKHYSTIPIIGTGDFPIDKIHFLTEFPPKPINYDKLAEIIKKYIKQK